MLEKLAALEARYDELSELLGSPEVVSKPELLMKYGQEQANLEPIVTTFRRYQEVVTQLEEARDMLVEESDEDMRAMVREEVTRLKSEREALEEELQLMLLPRDPNDDKNVIVEIRAGAGGDECKCGTGRRR